MTDKTIAASEQRRHARTAVGVTLDFRLAGENPSRCRGTITDLSQGGMTFKTDAVLEEGMTLHLKLPSSIQIRGEVRSVGAAVAGQRRYGVRFHKIGYSPVI
ncbi:MAG: PilZ domain-containing protein [Elusimicrobia bacterium]|nr:PilZ domain-containing protein [Elusimicrobiota bacterium]